MAEPAAPELEAPTPAENPEMHLPEDFGPGRDGQAAVLDRRRLCDVSGRHRLRHPDQPRPRLRRDADPRGGVRLCGLGRVDRMARLQGRGVGGRPDRLRPHADELRHPRRFRRRHAEPGAAHRACRLPRPARRRHAGAASGREPRRQGILVGGGGPRLPRRALSLGVLLRPRQPGRRPERAGHRRRRRRDRHALPARLARARAGSADRGGMLPRLLPGRPSAALAAQPSRLRFRADRGAHGVRDGGHLRHADRRLGDLHLPLHPVRLLHGAGRRHPLLQRDLDRHVRRHARRARERSASPPRR